jgi:hypothetical protein
MVKFFFSIKLGFNFRFSFKIKTSILVSIFIDFQLKPILDPRISWGRF